MQWLKCGGTLSGGTHEKWLASDCWQEGIIWSRGALEQADETVSPMSLLFPSIFPCDLSHKRLLVSSTGALCDSLDVRLPGELSREQHPFLRLPELWTKQTLFLRRHPAPTLYQSSTAVCPSFALPLVGNNSLGVSSPKFPGYTHMWATRMLHSPRLKLEAAKKTVWVKESWAHKECFPTAVLWVPGAILCIMGTKSNFGSNEQLNDCE